MSFDVKCIHCGATFVAQDDWHGIETNCPSCNELFIVKAPSVIKFDKTCPACGKTLDMFDSTCPECGHDTKAEK